MSEETKRFIEWLLTLTDDQRKDVIYEINRVVCPYCGSTNLPCYCMRDD